MFTSTESASITLDSEVGAEHARNGAFESKLFLSRGSSPLLRQVRQNLPKFTLRLSRNCPLIWVIFAMLPKYSKTRFQLFIGETC